MLHSWMLGLHHRDHKGILLEIASDLQQDMIYVFLPCLAVTRQMLVTDASRIFASTGQLLYLLEQVT